MSLKNGKPIQTASSVTLSVGTLTTAFSVGDTNAFADGNVAEVHEVTGTPGFNLIFDFGDNSRMARAMAFAFLKLGMIKLIPM